MNIQNYEGDRMVWPALWSGLEQLRSFLDGPATKVAMSFCAGPSLLKVFIAWQVYPYPKKGYGCQ